MAKASQIVLGLLAVSAVCVAAERPNREWMTLFQEAQYQEQTAGDLDKAITLYEQVLTEAAEVERLAARAALQLGVCYQKKGDTAKAADYFRQVVSKYPGQKELAAKAQKQLEKLGVTKVQKGNIFEILGPVCSLIGSKYGEVCAEAGMKKLYSNSNIYVVDNDFILRGGGMGYVYNMTDKPITERYRILCTIFPNQKFYSMAGDEMNVEIVPDEQHSGFYNIYWNPEEPLRPGEFYNYGWAVDGSLPLPRTGMGSKCFLNMNNKFGNHAYETFFLAVPKGTVLSDLSENYTDKKTTDNWDIYWWKKEVQPDENHVVTVTLEKGESTASSVKQVIFKDSMEQGNDMPDGWEKGNLVEGVEYIWDKNAGSDGKASLCLKKTAPKYFPIAQWTRRIDYTGDAKKIELSVKVQAKQVYKAVFDVLFLDKSDEDQSDKWIKHQWIAYIGEDKEKNISPADHNWKTYSGTADIPDNTKTIVIGLQMYGPGIVWFDEVEASYVNEASESSSKLDKPLVLEPSPWVDGEVMRLGLTTPAGMDIGEIVYTAKTEQAGNAPSWAMESYMNVPISSTQQYTCVKADADNFKPSSGVTKTEMGTFSAAYADNKVDLTVTKGDSKKTQTLTPQQTVYDNEQALYLIRRMPLAEGYSGNFYIFPVQSASVARVQIDVNGKETRTVPAGTFDCWKVTLAVYAQEIKALEHTLWFSADTHKYLVRYDSGQAIMELKETGLKSSQPSPLTFDSVGLKLPAGWVAMKNPPVAGYTLSVQLIPPAMEGWAVLTGAERIPMMDSAKMVADMDIEQLKGFFKDYTVRPDSRQELTIGDMPAASYIADYSDNGNKVEYRTYLLGSGIYWFVFRTDKDQFDAQKPAFESIVQSFGIQKISREKKIAAELLTAEGWTLWQERKLAEAEKKFEQAAAADPTSDGVYQGLGWAQLNQGKKENAKASFEKCVELNAENSAALNGLGWIAHGQNNKDEAIGWWEKAVKAQPGATAAISGLTQVYMERQDYKEAIRYYKLWLKAEPNNQDAKTGLEKAMQLLTEKKQ